MKRQPRWWDWVILYILLFLFFHGLSMICKDFDKFIKNQKPTVPKEQKDAAIRSSRIGTGINE